MATHLPALPCRHPGRGTPRRPRASVLVIVLVTLLFAATALVAFVEKAGDNLLADSREAIARRLRQDAYSALEVTLAVLEDFRLANGGLHSPAEGWDDPLGFAGWVPRNGCTIEVSFEDESGKLSLPQVDPARLQSLFESWGLRQREAEQLRDALLSWMRRDYVATNARLPDYEHASPPYETPGRSLRSFSELAAIDYAREVFYDDQGRPNELWHRFAATFSLLDFKQTNMNGVHAGLSDHLDWLDASQRQHLAEYISGTGSRAQQGPGYFPSATDAARIIGLPQLPSGFGTEITALRITVAVREGSTTFQVTAVVAPSGGATVVSPVPAETRSSTVGAGQQQAQPAEAKAASGGQTAKKLNYPFTLLEITENAVISTAPAAPDKA